jgi:FkbM family methyltransferase
MPLFNSLRLFATKVLAPAGFAVQRVKKNNPWGSTLITRQVGRFTIQVPRASQMAFLYEDHPYFMRQLRALTIILKKKYPNLSAIDVGANVGDTACVIKSEADIPIACIEGDDFTYGLLQANIRQLKNVTAYKLFLGEKTASMAASFEKAGWNTTIKPGESAGSQTIKILSLDDFIAAEKITADWKMMKIDAEGFDCSIIRGAAKFIRDKHPVLTFEYNRDNMDAIGEKGTGTLAMLRDLGYSQVVFHDASGRFFTATTMSNEGLIRDLLNYADGKDGAIYYFDLTMFHTDDDDIASEFINEERKRQPNAQSA